MEKQATMIAGVSGLKEGNVIKIRACLENRQAECNAIIFHTYISQTELSKTTGRFSLA